MLPWRARAAARARNGARLTCARAPHTHTPNPLHPPHPAAQARLFAVLACLLAVYVLVLALPLAALARRARAHRRGADDAAPRTSFRRNLTRRGSFGHLEFLGFETRKEIIVTNAAPGGGVG